MFQSEIVSLVAQILLIAGALNWGLVAFNGSDLVKMLVGNFDVYVKYIVAAAGLYAIYDLYVKMSAPAQAAAEQAPAQQ
jgi:uncharacterized membrane protein YuzA (DUF378 family)